MRKRIVTVTTVIVLTLGAVASADALNLASANAEGAALLSSGPKEHIGKVHRIKTRGPKKPDPPSMKDLRKPKPPVPLKKIKKPKKERVQRVL